MGFYNQEMGLKMCQQYCYLLSMEVHKNWVLALYSQVVVLLLVGGARSLFLILWHSTPPKMTEKLRGIARCT